MAADRKGQLTLSSRWQETPDPGPLACFRCGIALHGTIWEAVTKDRKIVVVCPKCTHHYARVRQRKDKIG